MTQRKIIPPTLLPGLRRDYEETDIPVADLAARAGMSKQTFYKWVRALGWSRRVPKAVGSRTPIDPMPPFWAEEALRAAALVVAQQSVAEEAARAEPQRSPALAPDAAGSKPSAPAAAPSRDLPAEREQLPLAARIQRSVERELDAVERVLALLAPNNGNEAERTARTLASLARTLREIVSLEDKPSAEPDDDDDPGPRDMDEFRRELARRMEAIIAEREGAVSRKSDG